MASSANVIAEQRDVTHGGNGFYDIRLLRQSENSLIIEVATSIFFAYIVNSGDSSISWTAAERDFFRDEWRRQVPGTWNRPSHTSYRGYTLSMVFTCDVRTSAEGTQWQAYVMKLKNRSVTRGSAVWRDRYEDNYDAKLDSNDDLRKSALGDGTQTAMIHEFGHMIGNADEYNSDSPHEADRPSVMNYGSAVRDRHLAHLVAWAKPHIDAL